MRKKLLINPKFQFSFIKWMIGIYLVIISIFYGANLYFFKSYFNLGKQSGLPTNHVFFEFIKDQYQMMNWIFIGTSLILFTFLFGIGLIISHRVAGPLHHLNEHFEKIANGNPPSKISFRKKDYFQELGVSYNKHLSVLLDAQKKKALNSNEQ